MLGYLINFSIYTLAMIGIIFIGFLVTKKSLSNNYSPLAGNQFLTKESCLNLEPRKNLYVVKAGKERFLVSTDIEGTHFLTKLEVDNLPVMEESKLDNQQAKISIPILDLAKNMFKSNLSQSPYRLRMVEKLNSYITFQKS